MIEVRGLTKRYGPTVAVDGLGFEVRPGAVTGFLGPNGSGKSTTMRMITGLDRPDAGSALIHGTPYRELRWPLREVGALLEARTYHPGRSAANHLAALAAANGIPRARVRSVLDTVGLTDVGHKRAGVSRWACRSGSASPPPCSAIREYCSSTSPSTGSTRRECDGSAT